MTEHRLAHDELWTSIVYQRSAELLKTARIEWALRTERKARESLRRTAALLLRDVGRRLVTAGEYLEQPRALEPKAT